MSRPAISVGVPVRNGARYLADTLESLLTQTIPDLEVIVSDDGSTDGSLEIARDLADSRVRIVHCPKPGIASNWNHCLGQASGDWFKLLPQDDLLDADCLERAHQSVRDAPDVTLFFSRRRVLHDPTDPWSADWVKRYETVDTKLEPLQARNDGPTLLARWARAGLRANRIGEPVATLFPTHLARELGGFSSRLRQDLDFAMWIRLMARGCVAFQPDATCTFRLHADSTTRRYENPGQFEREWIGLLEVLGRDRMVVRAMPEVRRMMWRERGRRLMRRFRRHSA